MTFKVPSELAIQAEMSDTGVGRMAAIRRLQQRTTLLTRQRAQREVRL